MTNQKTGNKPGGPRSAARLAAAQAFYQLLMTDEPKVDLVTAEYIEHRLGAELEDGAQFVKADVDLFTDILAGAWNRREEWAEHIGANLSAKWTFERLDKLLVGILSAGSYELAARVDVPTAVIINEYVDVTHGFYEQNEASFVNSVLDKIAKSVRS